MEPERWRQIEGSTVTPGFAALKRFGRYLHDACRNDEALRSEVARFDERKSWLVELRFFGGLSEEETAEVMKSSVRTVQREWSLARAWLFRELSM
jgi:DNA-directed RNA polymerase specialized sigma24 family protein